MAMIDVTLVVRTSANELRTASVELNEYYSVKEIKDYILKEIKTKVNDDNWFVDEGKTYTLSISPKDNSKQLGNVKLEDGCIVYLQEVPNSLIVKFDK